LTKICLHSVLRGGTVDGPGVRTVLFTQGCDLACRYCHNRDTWKKSGSLYDVDDVVALCEKDKPFYGRRGGVTVSGGEPLLQGEAVSELCAKLRKAGMHVCLDTAGSVLDEHTDAVLKNVDLVLLDIKHADPDRYRALTGGTLSTTLAFLERVKEQGVPFWIRHVVVEGWTDTEDEIASVVRLGKGAQRIELNGYHGYGEKKWEQCGVAYPFAGMKDFDAARLEELRAYADEALLAVNNE